MDINELGIILRTEVNSGYINGMNHSDDNGFFEIEPIRFIYEMERRGYEAMGICTYVPYPSKADDQTVSFVYRENGDIYWCHLPETYWFNLLSKIYGYNEADKYVSEILGF